MKRKNNDYFIKISINDTDLQIAILLKCFKAIIESKLHFSEHIAQVIYEKLRKGFISDF